MTMIWPFRKHRYGLGLEVNDTSLKGVQLAFDPRNRNTFDPVVEHVFIEPLPEGIVSEGEIQEKKQLAAILQKLVKQKGIKTKHVHVALPNSQVMIRFLNMPDIPEHRLRKVVDYEVKHNVYLPFSDAVYDFVKLERGSESAECEVMLVAAPRETRDTYVSVLRHSGLTPASMEVRALSIFRAIEASRLIDAQATFLQVDVHEHAADLSIFHQQKLQITRTISLQFSAGDVLGAACRELGNELERLMDFYRYTLNKRDHTFQQLVLTGDIDTFDEVHRELQQYLTVPVKPLDVPWLRVQEQDSVHLSAQLAAPLGLALRGRPS